ncbi:hypothetical protein SLA2020_277070 [Shorea laevis]
MIFFATKPVEPKKRADEKPVPLSSSDMNGVEKKPRLVFKIKLPPADDKGNEPCKVFKDKVDEKPAVLPTPSSGGMNGAEKKRPLVFKIKLPKQTDDASVNKGNESKAAGVIKETDVKKSASSVVTKDTSLPTSSGGIHGAERKAICHVMRAKLPTPNNKGIELIGNCGGPQSDLKNAMDENGKINPFSHRPKKSASSVVTKDRSSDEKSLPTSSTGINGAVMRVKLPKPNKNGTELNGNCSGQQSTDPKKAMDEKTERRVMNINLSAVGRNKVQQTGAKSTEKIRCLEKVSLMDEEALELKLEASKRKLQQRYQQAQSAKRKIEFLDFKDIPKPQNQNAPKRSRNQMHYRRS